MKKQKSVCAWFGSPDPTYGRNREKIDCWNKRSEEWKAADDGPEMNHRKIFKSFSVIYDVIHFNSRRGAPGAKGNGSFTSLLSHTIQSILI